MIGARQNKAFIGHNLYLDYRGVKMWQRKMQALGLLNIVVKNNIFA